MVTCVAFQHVYQHYNCIFKSLLISARTFRALLKEGNVCVHTQISFWLVSLKCWNLEGCWFAIPGKKLQHSRIEEFKLLCLNPPGESIVYFVVKKMKYLYMYELGLNLKNCTFEFYLLSIESIGIEFDLTWSYIQQPRTFSVYDWLFITW